MKSKTLVTLLLIAFLDMLGIGILIPVIPMLFAEPSSPYFVVRSSEFAHLGYVFLGLLMATYPFAQFFAAPILGQLSDKYGRRRILVFSQIGTCIGYALFAVGVGIKSLPLLFVSRVLDGFTGGNISVAQAALADITPPQARARTFGLMGAVFGFGFILGPFLGGVLSSPRIVSWFNPGTPFWFAALISLVSVCMTIFILKETHQTPRRDLKLDLGRSVHNIIRAFSIGNLRALFVTSFLFQSGFSFFTSFFSVYLIAKFAINQEQLGTIFGYIGIWIIVTQALITRALSHRFSETSILRVTFITCGLSVAMHFLPSVPWQLYLVSPFFAISNGLTQANVMGLLSRRAGSEIQGEVLGINASMQALANTIPPLIAGFLATAISPSMPMIVATVTIILAGVFFSLTVGRKEIAPAQ